MSNTVKEADRAAYNRLPAHLKAAADKYNERCRAFGKNIIK